MGMSHHEPPMPRTMVAPGIYFVSSPIIAIIALFMFSAFMVYVVTPAAGWVGLFFNDAARDKKKRAGLKKKAVDVLVDVLPEKGLTWRDVEDRQTLVSQSAIKWHVFVSSLMFLAKHQALSTPHNNKGGE